MAIASGTSKVSLQRKQTRVVGLGTAEVSFGVSGSDGSITWTDGDVVNGCQIMYSANNVAIAGSAGSETAYDLTASLLDPLGGGSQTWTKLKELWVRNNTTTAGATLNVAGSFVAAAILAGTTPSLVIGPGGWVHIVDPSLAGYPVVASTADAIEFIGNSAAAVNIDFFIAGVGTIA